ncbi:MAG TPA: hypothetical protein VGE67_11660 [Haloferula sp.]
MKPWRPYWKTLDRGLDILLKNLATPPWEETWKVGTWISRLNFDELSNCDMEILYFINALETRTEFLPQGSVIGGHECDWQMVLRLMCARSFCRGDILKRKEFDWSEQTPAVWKQLLVDLWRENGRYWAARWLGTDHEAEIQRNAWAALIRYADPRVSPMN